MQAPCLTSVFLAEDSLGTPHLPLSSVPCPHLFFSLLTAPRFSGWSICKLDNGGVCAALCKRRLCPAWPPESCLTIVPLSPLFASSTPAWIPMHLWCCGGMGEGKPGQGWGGMSPALFFLRKIDRLPLEGLSIIVSPHPLPFLVPHPIWYCSSLEHLSLAASLTHRRSSINSCWLTGWKCRGPVSCQ